MENKILGEKWGVPQYFHFISSNSKNFEKCFVLTFLLDPADCKSSCKIQSDVPKVSVRLLPTNNRVLKQISAFSLFIDPEVTVTESYIPEFSLSTFIADLGGSLGLWLGVGAVQIMSSGVALVNWIQTKKHLMLNAVMTVQSTVLRKLQLLYLSESSVSRNRKAENEL